MNVVDPGVQQHIEHEKSQQRQREREDAKRRIDDGRPPWKEERGVMAVVDAVRDMEFPKSMEDLQRDVGEREVAISGDTTFPMRDIIRRLSEKLNAHDPLIDDDRVPSLKDFQSITQRHWEAIEFMAVPEDQRPRSGGFQPQERDTAESGRR